MKVSPSLHIDTFPGALANKCLDDPDQSLGAKLSRSSTNQMLDEAKNSFLKMFNFQEGSNWANWRRQRIRRHSRFKEERLSKCTFPQTPCRLLQRHVLAVCTPHEHSVSISIALACVSWVCIHIFSLAVLFITPALFFLCVCGVVCGFSGGRGGMWLFQCAANFLVNLTAKNHTQSWLDLNWNKEVKPAKPRRY